MPHLAGGDQQIQRTQRLIRRGLPVPLGTWYRSMWPVRRWRRARTPDTIDLGQRGSACYAGLRAGQRVRLRPEGRARTISAGGRRLLVAARQSKTLSMSCTRSGCLRGRPPDVSPLRGRQLSATARPRRPRLLFEGSEEAFGRVLDPGPVTGGEQIEQQPAAAYTGPGRAVSHAEDVRAPADLR